MNLLLSAFCLTTAGISSMCHHICLFTWFCDYKLKVLCVQNMFSWLIHSIWLFRSFFLILSFLSMGKFGCIRNNTEHFFLLFPCGNRFNVLVNTVKLDAFYSIMLTGSWLSVISLLAWGLWLIAWPTYGPRSKCICPRLSWVINSATTCLCDRFSFLVKLHLLTATTCCGLPPSFCITGSFRSFSHFLAFICML